MNMKTAFIIGGMAFHLFFSLQLKNRILQLEIDNLTSKDALKKISSDMDNERLSKALDSEPVVVK